MTLSPKSLGIRALAVMALGACLGGIALEIRRCHIENAKEVALPRGPRMIHIPGGAYYPGPPASADAGSPSKAVTLPDFEMDETEVTVNQYARCVAAGKCKPADTNEAEPENRLVDVPAASQECNYPHRATMGNHPINCVGPEMAEAFCTWARKRLPTADEWEYAARGTDGRKYPWGNQEPDGAHLNAYGTETINSPLIKDIRHQNATTFPWNDGYPLTSPVGSFPKGRSPFGLYDMAGNVVEFAINGYGLHNSVDMGGAWTFDNIRLWLRDAGLGWLATSDGGIRCVRSVRTTQTH